jgi:hypothetical protein
MFTFVRTVLQVLATGCFITGKLSASFLFFRNDLDGTAGMVAFLVNLYLNRNPFTEFVYMADNTYMLPGFAMQ